MKTKVYLEDTLPNFAEYEEMKEILQKELTGKATVVVTERKDSQSLVESSKIPVKSSPTLSTSTD